MDTLKLLNDVARHLSKKDVEVLIQEPEGRGADGQMWVNYSDPHSPSIKIAISPRITSDAMQYLSTFLHEVAHAKLHAEAEEFERGRRLGIKSERFDGQFEIEARALSNRWLNFADYNWHEYFHEVNQTARPVVANFQAHLLALLNSPEAPKAMPI
jgi:hypothetical protein